MMGKKLLALLLCGALLVTVLAACGAPEEKEVSAEQDSQPVEESTAPEEESTEPEETMIE